MTIGSKDFNDYYQVVVALEKTTNVTDHMGKPKVRKWTESYLVGANSPQMAAEHTKQLLIKDNVVDNPYSNPDKANPTEYQPGTNKEYQDPYGNQIYRFDCIRGGFDEDKIWVVQVKVSPIFDVLICDKNANDKYEHEKGDTGD